MVRPAAVEERLSTEWGVQKTDMGPMEQNCRQSHGNETQLKRSLTWTRRPLTWEGWEA